MTDQPHSAARLSRRGLAVQAAASLAVTVALAAMALGEAGRIGVIHSAALTHLPHLPRLSLLAEVSPAIKIHLAAVLLALGVGAVLLAGVKGTRAHRILGWGWVVFMAVGAIASIFIRIVNHGAFSWLHLFTGLTLVSLPIGVMAARRHNVRVHGRTMTRLFVGGLIVAGLFAFMPGRLMWEMVFG